MKLLLLVTCTVLLIQQGFFLFGVFTVKKLWTGANISQGLIILSLIILAMIYQSWILVLSAFILERAWIIIELSILAFLSKRNLNFFYILQYIGLGISIAVLVSGLNWIFPCFYIGFWLLSLIQGKKEVKGISS
ncbi:MAG: hypothetical protein AAFY71_11665 [Bacteroidota bacterium]